MFGQRDKVRGNCKFAPLSAVKFYFLAPGKPVGVPRRGPVEDDVGVQRPGRVYVQITEIRQALNGFPGV